MASKKNNQEIDILEEVGKEIVEAQEEISKEILVNVPNTITLLRLVFLFVFIYMLFSDFPRLSLLAVFAFAAVTDWFDGFFARRLNQKTRFGAKLDQVVDRIFTVILVIALIIYIYSRHGVGINLFESPNYNIYLIIFLCLSREIVATPGVIIALFRKKGTYHVKYIGKVTTFIQSVAFCAIILGYYPLTFFLALVTCVLGIFSGLDYLRYSVE
jgi:CDP-diacylglycerol---glycerol-3-phosphate 3-phosphatidyltransferase